MEHQKTTNSCLTLFVGWMAYYFPVMIFVLIDWYFQQSMEEVAEISGVS